MRRVLKVGRTSAASDMAAAGNSVVAVALVRCAGRAKTKRSCGEEQQHACFHSQAKEGDGITEDTRQSRVRRLKGRLAGSATHHSPSVRNEHR